MAAPRDLVIGVIVALLAAASWWLARDAERELRRADGPEGVRAVDYYLRDLDFVTYSAQGLPARALQAPELRHYPDDDSTEVDDPRLIILKPGRPPWRVRAESGWISSDGELLRLRGQVEIEREAGEGVRPMRIVTRNLRVEPERDYAETDEAVTVTSLDDRIDSMGMQAWLSDPGRIKFLSQVRGHYAVPQ